MLKTFEVRRRIDHGTLISTKHEIFQFPGGESHINFHPTATQQVAYLQTADGNDLMELAMWADAVKRSAKYASLLVMPYIPGARADRGVPFGAKVYANFINSMGIDQIISLDPHSDVAPALYERMTIFPLGKLPFFQESKGKYTGVIAPDLGARKRAELIAGRLGVPVYQAMKHRDFATGKLSGFGCEILPKLDANGAAPHFLLVDDICDGGGTFIGLAKTLLDQQQIYSGQLDLWVTHGIFSQGVDDLSKFFTTIYTTDSHVGASSTGYYHDRFIITKLIDILVPSVVRMS
jgi:ribose-phosphate pyrophosphokinase